MNDLNFRKKRRRPAGTRKKQYRLSGRRLNFENRKAPLHFAKEKMRRRKGSRKKLVLWAVAILIVCMFAVLLVAAFGRRVSIAGDSMSPVLENGDVVLVNHFIYKVKKPSRGDIVAFRQDEAGHYSVKRVAGLPGETVQIKDGKLLIDGKEPEDGIFASDIEYAGEATDPVKLGKDEYFVIGDNDDASDDSRLPSIGNITKKEIFGQAWFIVSPAKDFGFVS